MEATTLRGWLLIFGGAALAAIVVYFASPLLNQVTGALTPSTTS